MELHVTVSMHEQSGRVIISDASASQKAEPFAWLCPRDTRPAISRDL